IGGSRHLRIGKSQLEFVKEDKLMQVKGDKGEKIGGNSELVVEGGVMHEFKSNHLLAVTNTLEVTATSIAMVADTTIELKVGGSSIVLTPAAIFIKGGPLVNINSGSGPPVPGGLYLLPEWKDPKAADTGRPGQVAQPPPPPQPPERGTFSYSPQVMSLRRAAETGSAFAPVFPAQESTT
ncbi:MAG: hypothetical protein GY953_28495, partial [bacterium]|nr:hypothetical protein [bacterium]